jgi:argininosuccinate lyase
MEFMIQQGVPQRTAHHLVGQLVSLAIQQQIPLAKLDADVFRDAHPVLDERVFEVLGVPNAIAAFCSYGSTAPDQVRQQVRYWQDRLARDNALHDNVKATA